MTPKRVTFDPEGPLWDTFSGERYPQLCVLSATVGLTNGAARGWRGSRRITCCVGPRCAPGSLYHVRSRASVPSMISSLYFPAPPVAGPFFVREPGCGSAPRLRRLRTVVIATSIALG